MVQSDIHRARIEELDLLLRRDDEFVDLALVQNGSRLTSWYGRLLTALTIVTIGERIEYATTQIDTENGSARAIVFTDVRVVVGEVDDVRDDGKVFGVHTVSRSSIRSLSVAATMSAEVSGRMAQAWPGEILIDVTYHGLGTALTLSADSYNPYADDTIDPIWRLLESLRADTAAKAP
jgi:hypothetical protein